MSSSDTTSTSEHDPTGHIWLSSSVNWECHICGEPVHVVEWLPGGGWRWEHIPKEKK